MTINIATGVVLRAAVNVATGLMSVVIPISKTRTTTSVKTIHWLILRRGVTTGVPIKENMRMSICVKMRVKMVAKKRMLKREQR